MVRGIVASLAVLLCLVAAGCGQARQAAAPRETTSNPTATSATSTPTATALPMDSACAVLTPRQVRRALDSGPVRATGRQAASARVQRCTYRAGGEVVLTTTVVAGYSREGLRAARAFAERRAQPGTIEPLPNLGRGGVLYSVDEQTTGVALALALDSGLTVVSLRAPASRKTLIALARLVPGNVTDPG